MYVGSSATDEIHEYRNASSYLFCMPSPLFYLRHGRPIKILILFVFSLVAKTQGRRYSKLRILRHSKLRVLRTTVSYFPYVSIVLDLIMFNF